jgi:hypothetical protein
MLYKHPPQGTRNYATLANLTLLLHFKSQVDNYSTDEY